MNTHPLRCLAAGLMLSACGVHARSERTVLPQFQTKRLETGTVLFAPTFERSLASPQSLSLDFGVPIALYEQQPAALRAAVQNFGSMFENGAARALLESGLKLKLLGLSPQVRERYFGDLGAFLNVTTDGTTHYEVPGEGFLKAAGVSVDYSLVLAKIECESRSDSRLVSTVDSTGKTHTSMVHSCRQSCESRFIVWSYRLELAISEGSVSASASCGKDSAELADAMGYEVASKAPFPKP
jgi:hypothetical protein